MQDADDQQDAADPRCGERELLGGDEAGDVVVPVALGAEVHAEEDVGREDQVVDDVGQHDVALAGQRVVVEDVGGVGAAEPLDERPQPDGDGDQDEGRGDFEDPPGHGEGSVRAAWGEGQDGDGREGHEGGGPGGHQEPGAAAPAVGVDAVEHPLEQVRGRRGG